MAEPDRREAILARLKVLFDAIVGEKNSFRNTTDIPETRRPAIVLLDADEVAEESTDGRGRPDAAIRPIQVTMTPEIYIMLGNQPNDVGTSINALRIKVIKAIISDDSLRKLCQDAAIQYLGFTTGFASGRSIEGEAGVGFSFRYLVQPSQL